MTVQFKVETGITPPRRGPKAKLVDYEALYPYLQKMKAGESIKVAEVKEASRNSSYLSVRGALLRRFEEIGGIWRVTTSKIGSGKMCEVRVIKEGDERIKTKKK